MSDTEQDWSEDGLEAFGDLAEEEEVGREAVGDDDEDRPETEAELMRREIDDEDDDPLAEGDAAVAPPVELVPSYAKCNAILFSTLVDKLEELQQCVRRNQRLSDLERIQRLLPAELVSFLRAPLDDGKNQPESIFPLFRLLMPDRDSSRFISLKESSLADIYADAFDFTKDEKAMLKNFGNPMHVHSPAAIGDFSAVLEHILNKKHSCRTKPSTFTLKFINDRLDELKDLKAEGKTGHDWNSRDRTKKAKQPTLKRKRSEWLAFFRPSLSAREHKWLVRIILRQLKFGIGPTTLLSWYDPRANDLWNARSTLKRICTDLAFSSPVEEEAANPHVDGPLPYLVTASNGVEFGTEFDPMRSEKTGFAIVLSNVSSRHREYFESRASGDAPVPPLAAVHPAFSVETKLDGERMLVHLRQDGVVRMHSRNHVWHSRLYAPVLGPGLRRAVGWLHMDVILDGEVIAWDDVRKETVPFGNNKTIANMRRAFMESKGLCDDRDLALHKEEEEGVKRLKVADQPTTDKRGEEFDLVGKQCWLKFVAFDVLYLSGPRASEFLLDTVSPTISPPPVPGSLINLDCMERKKLLYRIIEEQPEVGIVETKVIRPNGKVETGEAYFSRRRPLKECGFPVYTLDSIACCMSGEVRDLSRIDTERRRGQSDEEISLARALAVDQIYKHYVEDCREEGLIFKDLSTFYLLGERHRSKRYWLKFKPDYFNGAVASDLDVLIIGAYFASGLRSAGQPSSFLCACVDSQDPQSFLPLTKVNARSVKNEDYQNILRHTGYSSNEGRFDPGRWYTLDDHENDLPGYISHRSPQELKDVPDLWIDPDHSVVVTLNAGEIVSSDVFLAGLSLRFPRITRLRMDGDAKLPHDIVSDDGLWRLYEEVLAQRSSAGSLNISSLADRSTASLGRRFLTESEALRQERKKKPKNGSQFAPLVPDRNTDSSVLARREFTVLSGRYSLQNCEIDVSIAKREGWYEEASKVTAPECVQTFIKKHGGRVRLLPQEGTYVLGGVRDDARVRAYGREQAQCVIRWSYIFRLVARLLNTSDAGSNVDERLEPSVLDYLIPPQKVHLESVFRVINRLGAINNELELMRALDIIGQDHQASLSADKEAPGRCNDMFPPLSSDSAWQLMCDDLPQNLVEIVSPKRKQLWPNGMAISPVVMYPDIFANNFGLSDLNSAPDMNASSEDRWESAESSPAANQIEYCVHLAMAMGATVTSHLHSGVTHILCHLKGGAGWLSWGPMSHEVKGADSGMRQELIDKLNEFCRSRQVVLLSPAYLDEAFKK